jgi:hypothetical protein
LCKKDESEGEENVHVRRMVEIGVRKGESRTNFLANENETYNQRITGTIRRRTLRVHKTVSAENKWDYFN